LLYLISFIHTSSNQPIRLKKIKVNLYFILDNPVETEHAKIKDYNTKIKELLNQNEFINFDLLLDSLAVSSKFIRTSEEFDEIDRV